jgi:hypothetical protein
MADIKIREGKKIPPDKVKTLDKSKMGVLLGGAPQAREVEGQAQYLSYTRCPWCEHVGRSVIDSDMYQWYTCGMCGSPFQA